MPAVMKRTRGSRIPSVKARLSGAKSLQVFSFAPRLSCEQVKTNVTEENCGAGAELGFSGSSVDGLSSVSAKIMADRLGDRTTSSVQLNLQHRF